jgi:plastocyanin
MASTSRATLAALALVLSAAPGVAQTAAPAADRLQFIKVTARDYVYDAPATVQAGIATIQLINQGSDIHHVTVQELPEGRSVKDFFDATRNSGRAPTWSRSLGQTSTIANGGEAFITFRMPPGRYILSCLIPARDGRSHVAKGMYQVITATAAAPTAARPAAARKP